MSHFKNISIDLLENGLHQVSVTKAFDPEHGGGEQTFKENGGANPHFALDIAKQMITVSPSTRQDEQKTLATLPTPSEDEDAPDDSLTRAETATIICALRNFQENPEPHGLDPRDVLTSQQIDELCETISTQGLVTFRRS